MLEINKEKKQNKSELKKNLIIMFVYVRGLSTSHFPFTFILGKIMRKIKIDIDYLDPGEVPLLFNYYCSINMENF